MLDVCTLFYNIRDILASGHLVEWMSDTHTLQQLQICSAPTNMFLQYVDFEL